MFLKKVEISGFKSFASKTSLEFVPEGGFSGDTKRGITAIVGPNGSGKSNVADAIRWVMGEQSMKNLRGKKSEDIIFAGSGKKSRLGSANVSLYFDNKDKRIPLDFSEVAITRKLFRSGESEYLINGSRVRLLDVIDLLAKAGVGKESYCVINQGMSDAVLNATAAERRLILEDAAGVKHFQIKKERSIKKLELTRINLQRVKDLISEIEPHLRTLKRQAERAKKGGEISGLLKEKQNILFSYLWNSFRKEKEELSGEKEGKGALMMNVQREADKLTDEIGKHSKNSKDLERQEEMERKREELRLKLNALEKELVITEGRMVIEEEKKKERESVEIIPVNSSHIKKRLAGIRESQEKLIERIKSVEKMEDLQDIREFARAIQQDLFDLSKEIEDGKIEIKKEIAGDAESQKKLEQLAQGKIKTKEQIQGISNEIEKIQKIISEELELNRKMRQEFFELERKLHAKQIELSRLKDEFNESKVKLARIEVREEDLAKEIKDELKIEPKELPRNANICNEEEMRREIYKLKIRLEQIGGIDPLVAEEYEETNKRFEFLSQESEDLEKAIDSLQKVIREMEVQINSEFSKAFEEINKEFSKYFKIIFGGGEAHLKKLKVKSAKLKVKEDNADNNLDENLENNFEDESENEVGIDIFACPPGKKISSLAMLSGGERSLTSLALLFAIISYNPPPFAILDEVEAALDEANSRRFGRIIQELSNETQFIIISHNRETMRQASLLYGVTMGEDGVSKLLSVRLDQVGQGGKIIR